MSIKPPQADLNQGSQRASQVAGKSEADTRAAKDPGSPAVAGDTVTLTTAAARLLKLEESLANMPDMDSKRIAEVKAAIADGSYRVDPENIVDRLLSIEKEIS